MPRTPQLLILVLSAFAMLPAAAQQDRGCVNDRYGKLHCPPPGGRCMADINGEIRCSTPGGGILLDRYRMPVCGPGECITNRTGDIVCSASVRGSAALNINTEAVCTGGCVAATTAACATPGR